MNKISNTNSTHIMQTTVHHYNQQIPLILKNRDQYWNDLRGITNNKQYMYLFCRTFLIQIELKARKRN